MRSLCAVLLLPLAFTACSGQPEQAQARVSQKPSIVIVPDSKTARPAPPDRPAPPPEAPGAECVALVIGNGAYSHISRLYNTVNDATLTGDRLKTEGRCSVFLVTDLASPSMRAELDRFLAAIRRGATVYFYYSGHGGQLAGENVLLATDVVATDSSEHLRDRSIRFQMLLDEVRKREPKVIVAILDSCRTPLAMRDPNRSVFRSYHSLEYAEPDTVLIYATANGTVASELGAGGDRSLFTGEFLQHFVRGRDLYTAFHLAAEAVKKRSGNRQRPSIDFRGENRVCLGPCTSAAAERVSIDKIKPVVACSSPLPFPFVENNRWGFMSCDGRVIVPAIFSSAWRFTVEQGHEMAAVRTAGRDGLYGYINIGGTMVIAPQFDQAHEFRGGLAPVKKGRNWYFIGLSGEKRSQEFLYARPFRRGLAPVKVMVNRGGVREALWGFISTRKVRGGDGDERAYSIPPQFEDAQEFGENGLAAVKVNGKYGFIDMTGKFVIEPQFDAPPSHAEVMIFHEGVAPAFRDGFWGFINESGAWAVRPEFVRVKNFHEGAAAVQVAFGQVGKWGYIDAKGEFVIAPSFENAYDFSGGVAIVRPQGRSRDRLAPINKDGVFLRTRR